MNVRGKAVLSVLLCVLCVVPEVVSAKPRRARRQATFVGHAVPVAQHRATLLPAPSGRISIITIEDLGKGKQPEMIQLFEPGQPSSPSALPATLLQEPTPNTASASALYRSIVNENSCSVPVRVVRRKGKVVKTLYARKKCRVHPEANWWEAPEAQALPVEFALAQGKKVSTAAMGRFETLLRDKRNQHQRAIHPQLPLVLSAVYDRYPGSYVVVVSGHRHKGELNGSHHELGGAIDFFVPGVSNKELYAFLTSLDVGHNGIGIYPRGIHVHFDFRPTPSYRWTDYSRPGGGEKRNKGGRSTVVANTHSKKQRPAV